jgi:ElaB/YqjD/DUF883 family membrane-anchored ribosome-binding protein
MASRAKSAKVAEEISRIEDLIADLEKRLHRLHGSAREEAVGATDDIQDFVNEALAGIMDRVRESADDVAGDVSEHAKKIGGDAFKWLGKEIEQRPLVLLGVAAGIGFLLGMTRR